MLETLTATAQWVEFRAQEPLCLPEYKGSTFRGALGHALRRVACALKTQDCPSCLLRQRCAYCVCFETPVPEGAEVMQKYPYAPHPFVLEPPMDDRREFAEGESLWVRLLLTGRSAQFLAHFVYAFDEVAREGVGRRRGKMEMAALYADFGPERRIIYDSAKRSLTGEPPVLGPETIQARVAALSGKPFRIIFETPTRVKYREHFLKEPELGAITPGLLRRLNMLNYFFCGGEAKSDVRHLLTMADEAQMTNCRVRWEDWTRYSARQDTEMQMGGIMGYADYPAIPDELMTILCWGELLHIGKGVAFGLGKYQIEPLA